jgi:hypothetical protein
MRVNVKKVSLLSLIILVSIYLLFSFWIYISVRKSLSIAFLTDGTYTNQYSKYIDKNIYLRLNPKYSYATNNVKCKKLSIGLGIPIHNFHKGIVWIKYTYIGIDKESSTPHGCRRVPIKITVEFENGSWKIIDIYQEA